MDEEAWSIREGGDTGGADSGQIPGATKSHLKERGYLSEPREGLASAVSIRRARFQESCRTWASPSLGLGRARRRPPASCPHWPQRTRTHARTHTQERAPPPSPCPAAGTFLYLRCSLTSYSRVDVGTPKRGSPATAHTSQQCPQVGARGPVRPLSPTPG